MININQFKSAVHKYDLERPNLYAVSIPLPRVSQRTKNKSGLLEAYSETENGRLLTLFCKATNLPGVGLAVVDNKRYSVGPTQKMPVGVGFSDVNMTFMCDANGLTYNLFYSWINSIIPFSDGINRPGVDRSFQLEFKKNYETDIKINVYRGAPGKYSGSGLIQAAVSVVSAAAGVPFVGSLLGSRGLPDNNLELARDVTLYKSFPTSISDMTVSSSSGDSIAEFSVNFTYFNWSMKKGPLATGSGDGGGGLLAKVASFANLR